MILPNYLNEQILDGEPVPPWPYVQLTHGLLITLDASEALPTSCRCCGEAVSLLARSPRQAVVMHAVQAAAVCHRKPQAIASRKLLRGFEESSESDSEDSDRQAKPQAPAGQCAERR